MALLLIAADVPSPVRSRQQPPLSLIPWERLAADDRALVRDVLSQPSLWYGSRSEVFQCDPDMYFLLLYNPVLTLELWKAVGLTGASLEEVSPGCFRGQDVLGSSGTGRFVYKSRGLNVIYAESQCRSLLLKRPLKGRTVLVLRTAFFQEADGKTYAKHRLEAYVKLDSRRMKVLSRVMRPLVDRAMQLSLQQGLWFISLMCRYASQDPAAVAGALEQARSVPPEVREQMRQLLARVAGRRRAEPPASPGG